MIAILDNIRSIHNVGSIFRTSDAAGVEKIFLCGITATPKDELDRVNAKLAKVSLGSEDSVKWEKKDSTTQVVEELIKQNFQIYALELHQNSIPYYQLKISDKDLAKTALLIGNEVGGIDQGLLDQCDQVLEIPMRGTKESLNVSVAYGICLFHLVNSGRI